MARVGCLVAALLVLGFAVPGAARADADPASDYLYTTNVFLPLATKVSPPLARELRAVTAAAAKAGKPIRVALIATPTDLGGVPSLFGKPTCGTSDFLWAIPWEFSVAGGPRTRFAGGFTANHHATSSFFCNATIEKAGAGPFCRRIDGTTC